MKRPRPYLGNIGGLMMSFLPLLNPARAFLSHSPRRPFRVPKVKTSTGRYSATATQAALRRMTGWQISQWQRAGRPIGKDDLMRFVEMPRRKAGAR